MADTALKLVLLGTDKSASSTLRGVGKTADQTKGKLGNLGKIAGGAMLGIAGAAAAAIPAVVDFGKDSLTAFADADKAQKQLEDAYKRFPKVASVNIEALRQYNQAIQRKTGADADDIASGQSVLARYKLTGEQLKAMTPLLVDYATRTGKSIPDAAKALGKSLGGSTKLAKELGFEFKASKDPAKNYEQIMKGLKGTVGGYADSLPEAEKKQKILQATFGDFQEEIGERLQPAMLGLLDAGQAVLDWLDANPEVVEGVTTAFGLLGDAFVFVWDVIRQYFLPSMAAGVEVMANIVDGAAAAAEALGFGDTAKKLRTTAEGIRGVAKGISALANAKPPVIKPKVEDQQSKAKLKEIDTKIAALNKKKMILRSEGDTKGVKKVENEIKRLERQRHKVKVGVGFTRVGSQRFTISRGVGSGRINLALASGHPSTPGGSALTLVGESGPELVRLPTGSRVFSNGQSQAMANQGRIGGGGDTWFVEINLPPGSPRSLGEAVERALTSVKQSRGRGGTLAFERVNATRG